MKTHDQIDRRSLLLTRRVVEKIERGSVEEALDQARSICRRWMRSRSLEALTEWEALLCQPWPEVRSLLLEDSERGRRMRQSSPFCRVLTPRERWAIYRESDRNEAA